MVVGFGFLFCPEVIARGLKAAATMQAPRVPLFDQGGCMSWGGYKTKRWRILRESILRRDRYRCRESARYGVRAEADTVHHVWPAEDYPEYAWEPWNLISLTAAKHDAMHDRFSGKLTTLGQAWQRRVSPPLAKVP